MKICIIYNSHTGTTRALARNIGTFLQSEEHEVEVASIDSYDREFILQADLVLLGCWTSGLFFIAQHPDRSWKIFASRLPDLRGKKLVLFTTYKLAVGSMFRRMEAHLKGKCDPPLARIKVRGREIPENQRELLSRLAKSS
jgi:flavodoxin